MIIFRGEIIILVDLVLVEILLDFLIIVTSVIFKLKMASFYKSVDL